MNAHKTRRRANHTEAETMIFKFIYERGQQGATMNDIWKNLADQTGDEKWAKDVHWFAVENLVKADIIAKYQDCQNINTRTGKPIKQCRFIISSLKHMVQ